MCYYSIIRDEAVRIMQVQGFGKPVQQIRLFQRMGLTWWQEHTQLVSEARLNILGLY